MNDLSVEQAREVLANDCLGMGQLIDEHGWTCAVGALATALGWDQYNYARDAYDLVSAWFANHGRSGVDAARSLARVNDTHYYREPRVKAVLAWFDEQFPPKLEPWS